MSGYQNHTNYFEYIISAGKDHLKHKFLDSAGGLFWAVFNPLFQIILFSLVFSNIFMPEKTGLNSFDAPYVVYLCIALVPWLIFSESVYESTNAIMDNGYYLKKMPLPTWIFVAKCNLAFFIYSCIGWICVLVFSFIMGVQPTLWWLISPFILLLFQLLAFGITLITSVLNVFIKDTSHGTALLLQLIFWSMPLVYYVNIVPLILRTIIDYHPVYIYLNALRSLIIKGECPSPLLLLACVVIPFVLIWIGISLQKHMEKDVRDII
ncbi:MAG: hypothetical protein COA79_10100 [Planctomycetota bacterium]|nr:MAG: hypothetical protein COA79_10100 [Planctomycetota bacterium]